MMKPKTLYPLLNVNKFNRLLCIVLLVLLTGIIFSFPVKLDPFYPIPQSAYIFDNLPLFSMVYISFILVLCFLLYFSNSYVVKAFLLCLFGIVFWGFWLFISPEGLDHDYITFSHTNVLEKLGKIPTSLPGFGYFSMCPNLFVFSSIFSIVTGLELKLVRMAILLANICIIILTLFCFYKRILDGNKYFIATLATLFIIQGSIGWHSIKFFFPFMLGMSIFCCLLNTYEKLTRSYNSSTIIAFFLFFLAAIATHIYAAASFIFVLIGIWFLKKFSSLFRFHYAEKKGITFLPLIPCLVIFISWQIFYSYTFFGQILRSAKIAFNDLQQGKLLEYFTTVAVANLGGTEIIPVWVNFTRLFWASVLYIVPIFFLIYEFVKRGELNLNKSKVISGFVGIILFTAFVTFISKGGSEWDVYLVFAPLFAVPLLFMQFSSLSYKKIAVILALIIFVLSSLPTFLSFNDKICRIAVYPSEASQGEFLARSFGDGRGVKLFSDGKIITINKFYLPYADLFPRTEAIYLKTINDVEESIRTLVESFSKSKKGTFILADTLFMPYKHLYGIELDAPSWMQIKATLSTNNLIYSNGTVNIYTPKQDLTL